MKQYDVTIYRKGFSKPDVLKRVRPVTHDNQFISAWESVGGRTTYAYPIFDLHKIEMVDISP